MSTSQPSREIYVIDVPESKELNGTFVYNFFVRDESVNETGGVPLNILTKPATEVDTAFIQYSVTRAPRYVELSFTPPTLASDGNQVSDQNIRENAFKAITEQGGTLILRNIDKVVNEDDFASNTYVSIHFHDGEIDKKAYLLVSGTIAKVGLDGEFEQNNSSYKKAQKLIPMLPNSVSSRWVTKTMSNPELDYNAQFEVTDIKKKVVRPPLAGINAQINVKMLHDLVNRSISDPTATQASDIANLHGYSKSVKQAVNQRFTTAISEADYKSFVPYVDVRKYDASPHAEKNAPRIVGYIIDKLEILSNGTTKAHPPIVIDSPHVASTADFRVKFNTMYCYTVRTVALLTLPAIDEETGALAIIKVLVSSKPSSKAYVRTLKLRNPPPPADINFVWNYETDKLMVTWAFPVTSERDIKQFQVFRRDSVDHSFELQKVYDFDDSVVPFQSPEIADAAVVEKCSSPATWWIDDEFKKDEHFSKEKGRIYSVCSIDAHALTSNYSAQYRVWFDRFKNKLQKELVSHGGAPKPYPNLYLEGDIFVNTIKVTGAHTKRLKVFFNPEYYELYDDEGRSRQILSTKQLGGSYKLQFINLDNFKNHDLSITIDNRLSEQQTIMNYPVVQFGQKRKTSRTK